MKLLNDKEYAILLRALEALHRTTGGLLFFGLDRDCLDVRLLNRCPDRSGILPVVLVAGDKRLHGFAGEQLDLVTHRREFPCPVLRTATGFHADQALLPVGEVFKELLALELQAHDFSGLHVDRVQLKYPFGDIDADYVFATIHFGPSGLPVKIFVSSTLGTSMPSAREGPLLQPTTIAELSTAPVAVGHYLPKTTGAADNSCSVLTGWEASIQFSVQGWGCDT